MATIEKDACMADDLEFEGEQEDQSSSARARRIRDDLMRMKGELTALRLEAEGAKVDFLAYLLSVSILAAHEAAEQEDLGDAQAIPDL